MTSSSAAQRSIGPPGSSAVPHPLARDLPPPRRPGLVARIVRFVGELIWSPVFFAMRVVLWVVRGFVATLEVIGSLFSP